MVQAIPWQRGDANIVETWNYSESAYSQSETAFQLAMPSKAWPGLTTSLPPSVTDYGNRDLTGR